MNTAFKRSLQAKWMRGARTIISAGESCRTEIFAMSWKMKDSLCTKRANPERVLIGGVTVRSEVGG